MTKTIIKGGWEKDGWLCKQCGHNLTVSTDHVRGLYKDYIVFCNNQNCNMLECQEIGDQEEPDFLMHPKS